MSVQYNNFKEFLEGKKSCKVLCTLEEFKETKKIVFQCEEGHINSMQNTSFRNKKTKINDTDEKICAKCALYSTGGDHFKQIYQKIYDTTGHILLKLDKNKKIEYQCGNCGDKRVSNSSNLMRSENKGTCPTCQRDQFKNSIEKVKKSVESVEGYKLNNYINCKDVEIVCPKNHTFNVTLSHFNEGRRCPSCAPESRKNTNLERYGVENVIHNVNIFDKNRKTLKNCKNYVFPSGKNCDVLGNEDLCITELLNHYDEKDIIVEPKDIPVISYTFDNKKAIYYPDIFIKSKNTLIEVKSDYTYKKHMSRNNTKLKECAKNGYNVELWIYNKHKDLIFKKCIYAKGYNDDFSSLF